MNKENAELWNEFSDIEFDISGKIQNLRKLQKKLKELALSEEPENIQLIAKIASKYVSLNDESRKSRLNLCYPLDKGKIYNALYLDNILEILYTANTKLKNEMLHKLADVNIEFIDYRIKTAPRLFSAEYVFENFSDDVIKYNLKIELKKGYDIYNRKIEFDNQRNWDKRWGLFLIENGFRYSCSGLLYDSDEESWSKFLASCKISEFEGSGLTKRQFRQDCKWFGEVLQKAYKNNHPEREIYYDEFLKQGFPKDLLDKYVSEYKL